MSAADSAPTDQNEGRSGVICDWVLTSSACVVVLLRFYAKCFVVKKLGWDDSFMALALLCAIAHATVITISFHYGFGRHAVFLSPPARLHAAVKWIFISQGFGVIAPMFGRIAFCIYMLKIVGQSSLWQRYSLQAMISSQAAINIVCVVMIYTQCGSHVSALWGATEAECLNPKVQTYYGYVQSAFNSFSDLYLTVLPAIVIWRLQLPVTVKVGLTVLLCLSIFAFVASVVKTYQIHILDQRGDITYHFVDFVIWASMEIDLVIIVASIPTLRPLFVRRPQAHAESVEYEMYNSGPWTDGTGRGGKFSSSYAKSSSVQQSSKKERSGLGTSVSEEEILDPRSLYAAEGRMHVDFDHTR